jgi:glycosyltransferase involved in cell wall biosynthesis
VLVDIVIPVYNEERVLASTVDRLTAFLDRDLPYRWRIVIANNQSTDRTREVGESLSSADARVTVLTLPRKGRGLAVREAWLSSDADIVSYMDADLSTDLRYLPLLVENVRQTYDMAVASRLLPASRVVRSAKREQLSRAFNRLIRTLFRTRFTDTQCGFKAMRRDVAGVLLPHVHGEGWFFDVELLVLAERNGFRVLELPVEWTDDPDSRVRLGPAAREIARELLRMSVRRVPRDLKRELPADGRPRREE